MSTFAMGFFLMLLRTLPLVHATALPDCRCTQDGVPATSVVQAGLPERGRTQVGDSVDCEGPRESTKARRQTHHGRATGDGHGHADFHANLLPVHIRLNRSAFNAGVRLDTLPSSNHVCHICPLKRAQPTLLLHFPYHVASYHFLLPPSMRVSLQGFPPLQLEDDASFETKHVKHIQDLKTNATLNSSVDGRDPSRRDGPSTRQRDGRVEALMDAAGYLSR
ncbi:hypothetical protein B0H14DRAFT_3674072 [Mycena olivaceomarginata]|nr:hypothetical protein B0H14DRAFT_3674072 [Mycena olivaceomarginata]